MQIADLVVDTVKHTVVRGTKAISLTNREFAL
jgi:DNA-binding response OmpR family regulator